VEINSLHTNKCVEWGPSDHKHSVSRKIRRDARPNNDLLWDFRVSSKDSRYNN